jgi:hypothetical protein
MDSKLKRKKSVHWQAKANREAVTTPLFKLYQTNRARSGAFLRQWERSAETLKIAASARSTAWPTKISTEAFHRSAMNRGQSQHGRTRQSDH